MTYAEREGLAEAIAAAMAEAVAEGAHSVCTELTDVFFAVRRLPVDGGLQ